MIDLDICCSLCYKDLDKSLYQICVHPQCNVLPLCLPCFENVNEVEIESDGSDGESDEAEDDDKCLICKDGGELVECGRCGFWYCTDCLDNLSINNYNDDSDWLCIQCDKSLHSKLSSNLHLALRQSMYFEVENGSEVEIMQNYSDIHSQLKNAIEFGNNMISLEELNLKREEIIEELKESNQLHLLEDEVQAYKEQWERDVEILNAQQFACKEILRKRFQCISDAEYYDLVAANEADSASGVDPGVSESDINLEDLPQPPKVKVPVIASPIGRHYNYNYTNAAYVSPDCELLENLSRIWSNVELEGNCPFLHKYASYCWIVNEQRKLDLCRNSSVGVAAVDVKYLVPPDIVASLPLGLLQLILFCSK